MRTHLDHLITKQEIDGTIEHLWDSSLSPNLPKPLLYSVSFTLWVFLIWFLLFPSVFKSWFFFLHLIRVGIAIGINIWNCMEGTKLKLPLKKKIKERREFTWEKRNGSIKFWFFFSNLCGLLFWLKLVCSLWIVLEKKKLSFIFGFYFILFF
jgi:hypothetical protein